MLAAARHGRLEVLKTLFRRWTMDLALCEACEGGHFECTQSLLQNGVNPNTHMYKTGDTALILSCGGGYAEQTELLLKHGADPNRPNVDGTTPLIKACKMGDADMATILLRAGADPNQMDFKRLSPLMLARAVQCVAVLLSYEADPNQAGARMMTPVHGAGEESFMKLLIDMGADVNALDMYGYSPLMIACELGNEQCAKLLLSRGASAKHRNVENESILELTRCDAQGQGVELGCCQQHTACATLLIRASAPVEVVTVRKSVDSEVVAALSTSETLREVRCAFQPSRELCVILERAPRLRRIKP